LAKERSLANLAYVSQPADVSVDKFCEVEKDDEEEDACGHQRKRRRFRVETW
jgi:hypothetical protein